LGLGEVREYKRGGKKRREEVEEGFDKDNALESKITRDR